MKASVNVSQLTVDFSTYQIGGVCLVHKCYQKLLVLHMLCRFIILTVSLAVVPLEAKNELCVTSVQGYTAGLATVVALCAFVETSVVWISMRGTIFHTEPRACMSYFVYGRIGKISSYG